MRKVFSLVLCLIMLLSEISLASNNAKTTECKHKDDLITMGFIILMGIAIGGGGSKGKSNKDKSYDTNNNYQEDSKSDEEFCPYSEKEYCEYCPLIDPTDTLYDKYWKCRHFNCYVNPDDEPWYNFENRKYR